MKTPQTSTEDVVLNALAAGRSYSTHIADQRGRISISLQAPVQLPPEFGGAYICKFEVVDQAPFSHFALGEDADQAARLAVHMVESAIGRRLPAAGR
jgi:hypothetical protein